MTLLDRPMREQAAAIAARDADAGELLDETLARIEARNPELNAIVATFPDESRFTGLANLAGNPAISVPVGLGEAGMPVALQLQAAWGRDELLLDAAEALEQATGRRQVEARPALAAA